MNGAKDRTCEGYSTHVGDCVERVRSELSDTSSFQMRGSRVSRNTSAPPRSSAAGGRLERGRTATSSGRERSDCPSESNKKYVHCFSFNKEPCAFFHLPSRDCELSRTVRAKHTRASVRLSPLHKAATPLLHSDPSS